jgi:hypothetical protein
MDERRRLHCWGMVCHRECLVPTWRGWVGLLLILLVGAALVVRNAESFLAVTDSKPGGILVVEGWASDYVLRDAIAEFRRHQYSKVYVTGVPIDSGSMLVAYKSFAELGAVRLIKLGLSTNVVQAVPAPSVRRDRTYDTAVALRDWFEARHLSCPSPVNVLTEGPHARRSRLLFEEALGSRVTVGIIAAPPGNYNSSRWWRSSAGVRNVLGEALAYIYARFFFWPPRQN